MFEVRCDVFLTTAAGLSTLSCTDFARDLDPDLDLPAGAAERTNELP